MSAKKTVLLVDDEHEFVAALAARLEMRDVDVESAPNGETALAKAEQRVFDAILLDMAMPGMDGIETLKSLLHLNADLQVILLTGKATIAQAVEAIKLGALDLLEKPADIDTLVERIELAASRKLKLSHERIDQTIKDIMATRSW
jgi:DNA-binding NtrC family response regulator